MKTWGFPYIVPLSSPDATDISMFGAKAATLARTIQFGYAVPDGFVVSRLYTENEFAPVAQEIISELFPSVAVRSSATKEDSETKGFAGVFETRLGIKEAVDLMNAFTIVKNSGTTNFVKNYHGEIIPAEQIAVLVQRMVNASRAGVAFSRDPNTGESKIIIEGNYGLGKSVVDGSVTPDSIEYLNDETYTTFVGRKSTQITLTDNGIHEQNTPTTDSQRCSLTNEEIKEIAILTQNIERDLGFAVDIEWAFDADGILWLLQARPITTI